MTSRICFVIATAQLELIVCLMNIEARMNGLATWCLSDTEEDSG
ncbi:MAG: hypothetical protein ACJ73C_07705 [Nitrososphaeraceae archaeon]